MQDETGRIVKQVDPDGSQYEWLYDPSGKHVARLGPFRNILPPEDSNEPDNNALAHRGPTTPAGWLLGHEPARAKIGLEALPGSVRAVLSAAIAAQQVPATTISRDLNGRIQQKNHASGAVEHFQYDAEGNLTAHLDVRGQWWQKRIAAWDTVDAERTPSGAVTQFGYTHRRRRAFVIDGNGSRTDYRRDKQQRVIEIVENGKPHLRYVRDPRGVVTEKQSGDGDILAAYQNNELGLRSSCILASGASYTYEYDSFGNLTKASSQQHEVTQAHFRCSLTADLRHGAGIQHFYGADERVERSVFLKRFVTEYVADGSGGAIRIETPDGVTHLIWRSTEGAYVRENGNGSCEALVFDHEDRATARAVWKKSRNEVRSMWNASYKYVDGLLEEESDSRIGDSRYTYDADRRLVTQHGPGSAKLDYRYDNAGNLSFNPAHHHIERRPDNLLSHTHNRALRA